MNIKERQDSIITIILLLLACIISFMIRTIPKSRIFLENGLVKFSGNDPWYHFRNIDFMVHNFPNMLWFDPYTYYPYGTPQVFAPLYDITIATVAWLIGMGNPSSELVYTIAAYFPVILGVIMIFPVYVIGKTLFNRGTGLFAAYLIAFTPGEYLFRSSLGFNDHHIAESLLCATTAMFIIISLKKMTENNISFDDIKDYTKMKTVMPYIILSGISLGAYTLAWKGALFFSFIIGVYIVIQHIIDNYKGKNVDYLTMIGTWTFAIAILIISLSPYVGGSKLTNMIGLTAGIIAFPILNVLSKIFHNKGYNLHFYPLIITVGSIVGILSTKLISDTAYNLVISIFSFFMRTGGGLTVAEAAPLLVNNGAFTLTPFAINFAFNGFISLGALSYLGYKMYKKQLNSDMTFMVIWSIMIIWAMLQQKRFTYYYAVNVAILASFVAVKILNNTSLNDIIEKVKTKTTIKNEDVKWSNIIVILLVILVFMYPGYNIGIQQMQYDSGINDQWHTSMNWLEANTPDPGLDYYGIYEAPKTGEIFNYPDEAYGVMSWWDYGHWIEVIGHRMPNANPFQRGIGGRRIDMNEENLPGAATFFTAQTEEESIAILDAIHPDTNKMGARYIVTDIEMATSKFYAMTAWTLDTEGYFIETFSQVDLSARMIPSEKYYLSMISRLHLFDTNGLKHYRMIYESATGVSNEKVYKNIINTDYGGNIISEDTGYVKIFEYVEGATIKGTAPINETVILSLPLKTNMNREFVYTQQTISDGTYSFIVPYSTSNPIIDGTNFVVTATDLYTVSYNDTQNKVNIDEIDIINGNIIEVNND